MVLDYIHSFILRRLAGWLPVRCCEAGIFGERDNDWSIGFIKVPIPSTLIGWLSNTTTHIAKPKEEIFYTCLVTCAHG